MSKGNLFILSGPSGSGKDTVLAKVFEKYPDIYFSISSVTRAMRKGEKQGDKYNFITREKFEQMIKDNLLLEYNIFVDNYYGTPREPVEKCIEEGRDVIVEVDVNGAYNIRKNFKNAVSIFIMPPSLETLKNRLSGRETDSAEVIESRTKAALKEIARAGEYDYIVVNNDLDRAVEDVCAIIRSCSLKIENQEHLIKEVLGLERN